MKKVLIYVEGPTEEAFVNKVIAKQLMQRDVYIVPTIATTKLVASGPNYKGGYVKYPKAKKEIQRLLGDSSAAAVTTMLDFYGLPDSYPGKEDELPANIYEKVEYLETKFSEDINDSRFIPYLSLHEFEAMVFCSVEEICKSFPALDIELELNQIVDEVESPEEINEGENTHPVARLLNIIPEYVKVVFGPLITRRTGLEQIRNKCPHFNSWLSRIENLVDRVDN